MLKITNFLDLSRQLNLKAQHREPLAYHAPQGRYKIVHQSLVIPGLPAPLYYLNFFTLLGQPNLPIWLNADTVFNDSLDTATVLVSASPHMVGHLKRYSISRDCQFEDYQFRFAQTDIISGQFPQFRFQRLDTEFQVDLQIRANNQPVYFSKLRLNLMEFWSVLCDCQGQVRYQGQTYHIQGMGALQYARSVHMPPLPLCFYTCQILHFADDLQIVLQQVRDQFNQVVISRCYIRQADGEHQFFDQHVQFKIDRVYPWVQTPNAQRMYLPREFNWRIYQDKKPYLTIHAQSRGDFKFGLGAGYVGSFRFDAELNGKRYSGESGYCEYVDCRPLKWQENQQKSFFQEKLLNTEPCLLKSKKPD